MEAEAVILLRMFDAERDYEAVSEWWEGHGWPAVARCILPRLGIIAETEAEGLAASWLYMDNSTGVAMMEWTVGNPHASPRLVLGALRKITEFLKAEANRLDYGVILTTCRQPGLVKFWEKRGFQKTDEGVTHLLYVREAPAGGS